MGWVGGTIGFLVGSRFGALAGILGAVIGNKIGNFVSSGISNIASESPRGKRPYANARGHGSSRAGSPREREIVFLTAVGAMLAKLAKADGHIDESEIAAAEQAFERLELTPANRAICIRAFRAAKADYHTIFDYAESFASVARGVVMRELMYDILWDVACADGEVSASERRILEMIVTQLRIRPSLFAEECHRRLNEQRSSRRSYSYEPSPYDILGCDSSATDDELRRAYRAQAKKHHPDLLRAQGLPEEMIARATEQMARINNAWEEIKRARGI
jgi:DnaJ like chaperone protein